MKTSQSIDAEAKELRLREMLSPAMVYIHDGDPLIYNVNFLKQYFSMSDLLILREKIERTIQFTEQNDIHALNNNLAREYQAERDEEIKQWDLQNAQKHKQKPVQFVYLMIDDSLGYVKIGRSKEPKHREVTLQAQKPTIRLLATWQADTKLEEHLHNHFADKRVRGEWFAIDPQEVIDYVTLRISK